MGNRVEEVRARTKIKSLFPNNFDTGVREEVSVQETASNSSIESGLSRLRDIAIQEIPLGATEVEQSTGAQ